MPQVGSRQATSGLVETASSSAEAAALAPASSAPARGSSIYDNPRPGTSKDDDDMGEEQKQVGD